jgi:glycoside/pentoside/hexuronide:cation symporter, GPH family
MNVLTDKIRPFGYRDKLGYLFGDLGNDFTFIMMASFLMLYFTDILGLPGMVAGLILMGARVWDAFADLSAGLFIDLRKPGKSGKFRPFLLLGALPVTILGVLTFTNIPGFSAEMKLVWGTVTYVAWGTAYSFINIPYGSLASVITEDPVQRASLSTWRTIGALIGNTTVTTVAPLFIFSNVGKPTALGFFTITAVFAVGAVVSYVLAYFNSVERIPAAKAPKLELKKSLGGLIRNRPLIGLMLTSFSMLIASLTTATLNSYLFKDFFHSPKLLSYTGLITLLSALLVIPFVHLLVRRFGKKETSIMGIIIALVFYLVQYLVPIHDPYVFMVLLLLAMVGLSLLNVLIWALVADAIDYQELLTRKREEGIVYSLYSFMRKMGQAAAGGFGGLVLGLVGYVSGQAHQSATVASGVRNAVTLIPALCMAVCLVSMGFIYNLSKLKLVSMKEELSASRAARGF